MPKEELDIVDADNLVIATAEREEAHDKLLRHRAIQVFVLNKKGEIFMQKRSKTKDCFSSLFECSASGHVNAGETASHAALRELKEELGIAATHLEELFQFKAEFPPEHLIVTQYILENYEGPIQLDPIEVESGGYITFAELDKRINKQEFHPAFIAAYEQWKQER